MDVVEDKQKAFGTSILMTRVNKFISPLLWPIKIILLNSTGKLLNKAMFLVFDGKARKTVKC